MSEKYRDRAKERREGVNTDQSYDPRTSTSGYRAVAPDIGMDAAERRRKMIQESKFLGGDLLHTHLVKGLDYALLSKVRCEITQHEKFQEAELEKLAEEQELERSEAVDSVDVESEEAEFKTVMGMNVHRWVQIQKSRTVDRNEMFAPGRMAFLVELDDENAESDIPTTITRSKAETNATAELHTLETTHEIVVNKLAQIFSYLRQGGKKKNKKKDKEFKVPEPQSIPSTSATSTSSSSQSKSKKNKEEDSIYGDIGDYKPPSKDYKEHRRRYDDRNDYHKSSSSSSSKKDKQRGSYFEKPAEEDVTINIPVPKLSAAHISKLVSAEIDGYQECYPGLAEMDDAVIDSDEEVDYTKMDKGSKKGAIGRWDFETQDEYSEYMNQREALPKAAFQYGLKMSEGRKTRKNKNENQKLDQEWQKIQKIITKRKGDNDGGEADYKKSKH